MANLIENIVGKDFNTTSYINNTITLIKSILIKNDNEAKLYNDYIKLNYPYFNINENDKTTWRYYLHLSGNLHPLDPVIELTSLDNGSIIPLNKQYLNIHQVTKNTLLKFGSYYSELVQKYPEQELYIKAVITDALFLTIDEIITLEDFSIVSYNKNLVEFNENNLIDTLQLYINNYKVHKLIPYYSISDSLFLTSQYHILYTFLLMSVLSIRLKNVKTIRAHSYHIKNYLASHHNLDVYYNLLTPKQIYFLYRNLLYLDNHSGRNDIFRTLIDLLFSEKNISLVTYDYNQKNTLTTDSYIDFYFSQRLLNKKDLVYSKKPFSLTDIENKEKTLLTYNKKEWESNKNNITFKLNNSLFNYLLTKDLETVLIDNTDTVKHKYLTMIIDYWAYLLKNNKINYLTSIVNPITNRTVKLNADDIFKLYVIALYKRNNVTLVNFPDYQIKYVFKDPVPSINELLSLCYKEEYWYKDLLTSIVQNIPTVSPIVSSSQFENYMSYLYKFNLGLWLLLTNLDNKNNEGQFETIVSYLNQNDTYSFNNETVTSFLNRIGFTDIFTLSNLSLDNMLFNIVNSVMDNKLGFLNEYKSIQKAYIEIFNKFTSYTTQIISNYYNSSPYLAGQKDTRYSVSKDVNIKIMYIDKYLLNVETDVRYIDNYNINYIETITDSYNYNGNLRLDISVSNSINSTSLNIQSVIFNYNFINTSGNDWIVTQSSDDVLNFLSFNL